MSRARQVKQWRQRVGYDSHKRHAWHGFDRHDAEPTRRRIQALCALGWSVSELSRRSGVQREHLREIAEGDIPVVGPRVRMAVTGLYATLSGSTPQPDRYSTRMRNIAAAKGWASPLAWDDIDNDPEPADLSHLERLAPFDWAREVDGHIRLRRMAS